jgi:hypothetical protein
VRKALFVLVPLLIGIIIYSLPLSNHWVRNYVPDGLWAFSFGYAFLWIWKPTLFSALRLIPLLVFFAFELFQKFEIITGTFDLVDCLVYLLFYLAATILFYWYEQKTIT